MYDKMFLILNLPISTFFSVLSFVVKKKDYSTFEESLSILQNYAATKGLIDEDIDLLADIIINTELGEYTNCYKKQTVTFY